MTYEDAVSVLKILRRQGYRGIILGTATMARASFGGLFADEPEERATRGFFTDGIYAASPMILDSANAETLAFAERFHRQFGRDPAWESVQSYDGARLAIAAIRASPLQGDRVARRGAILAYLTALDSPARAMPGLVGPIWFTPERIRHQAIRIGHFKGGLFESAPLQIVPVAHPDPAELVSGAVFETAADRYARLQRVVYTGIFVNEIHRLDLPQSLFEADFYLWFRFARDAGSEAADPTDITFPNLVSSAFDRRTPAEEVDMADGTAYRLWRVQGAFRNDYDMHRFPFDRQTLALSFFNAQAAADRIIYVLDRRTMAGDGTTPPNIAGAPAQAGGALAAAAAPAPVEAKAQVSENAFHNLTQWEARSAGQRRENLVTASALGDLRRVAVESYRELSGFIVTAVFERRALATLVKTMLPLLVMTLILYASLFFPVALVKEKVTVAITGALSGAVLLAAINSQLGGLGYIMAVEYAFYVFFGLSVLCVTSVLAAERLRAAGRPAAAGFSERIARIVFPLGVLLTVAGALGLYYGGS
jgi:hypothetical protein